MRNDLNKTKRHSSVLHLFEEHVTDAQRVVMYECQNDLNLSNPTNIRPQFLYETRLQKAA